jgi:hypothetical protein
MDSKNIIPAGGTSVLGSESANLTKFQPKPTPREILNKSPNKIKTKIKCLNFGDEINLATNHVTFSNISAFQDYSEKDKNNYAIKKRTEMPNYKKLKIKTNKNIDKIMDSAIKNYISMIKHFKLRLSYEIKIVISKSKTFIWKTTKKPKNKITFNLHKKLLQGLVFGDINWNNVESSCLIKISRRPDIYNSTLHYSMVFLKAKK